MRETLHRVRCLIRAQRNARRSAADLERRAHATLIQLVRHVWRTNPAYQARWRAAGLSPEAPFDGLNDLTRLPIVGKAFMRAAGPHGPLQAGLDLGALQLHFTSGSSGQPLTIATTGATYDWYLAVQYRVFSMVGCKPRDTIAYIKPRGADTGAYFGMFTARHIPGDLQPAATLDAIEATGARILSAYPNHLLPLLARCDHARLRGLKLKAVSLNSEMSTEAERARLGAAFGCVVQDDYGCEETWMIAASCPEGQRHVFTDNVWLEVLDDNDQPCPPGTPGRAVITSLANHACPIIRYDLGDRVTMAAAPCPCGRGFPVLEHLEGRHNDPFMRPDGSTVSSPQIYAVFLSPAFVDLARAIAEWQVIQTRIDHVQINVVPLAGWQRSHAAQLVDELCALMGPGVQIDLVELDALERQANQKRRAIIQCIQPT
jgi:phenylacetate-CoA ligase